MHLRSGVELSTSETNASMEEQNLADTYSTTAEDGSSSSSGTTSRSTNPDSLQNANPSLTTVIYEDENEHASQSQRAHSQGASSSNHSTQHTRASSQSPRLPPPAVPTPPPIPLSHYPSHYQRSHTQPRTYRPILPWPPNRAVTATSGPSVITSSPPAAAAPTQTDAADDPWSPHNPQDLASRQRRISQNAPVVAVRGWGYEDKMGRELDEMITTGKKRRRDDGTDDVPEGHDSRRRREDEDPDNGGDAGMSTGVGA